ncbi:endo-1,4-beta-xylanase [Hymenobacter cavernae]|uniref:Beta-xylanase n=1 Tax=Hymenobacter cavernae TaxID=2044852 RepID=A0ABQ1UJC6_9BACT|nr:endo-1,4-beta-xylanase [Hymenobacter cavernae]GGF19435.1 hypothetical protein GCM10011383_33770 [Hymenobacter cavernae]
MIKFKHTLFFAALFASTGLYAQTQNAPIIHQAESGVLGSDWNTPTAAGVTYIAPRTDYAATQFPGNDSKVATYTVTFPAPGSYDLYARIRVGANSANDDSFYYANGFGTKSPTATTDWVLCNGLYGAGYTDANAVVEAGGPAVQSNVWKWLNLSKFNGGATPISFTVTAGNLTQTFQIGSRENGLDIDKIVFGGTGIYFTVGNLDNGQPGSTTPPTPPNPVPTPTGPPLAAGKSKFLGGIYSPQQLPNFLAYWNQLTPENAGKWGSVEGTRDVMNWTEMDAAYKLAKDNGLPFKMHTLLWGSQQPTWIATLPPAEQLAEINQWFMLVAQRYPNIDVVEVVNEPLHAPPTSAGTDGRGGNYANALGGSGTTGWDWVITGFQLARQYFPNAKLWLNDYSVENSLTSAQNYVRIINLLKDRGLIDGIGVQGHAFSTRGTSAATLTSTINSFAATGLPVYITELDIDALNAQNQIDDQVQLAEYQRVFPLFWENPGIKGITIWGYRLGHWRSSQGAYLVNADETERPALVWLRNYVRQTVLGTKKAEKYAINAYPNPAIGGKFTLQGTEKISQIRVLDLSGKQIQVVPVAKQPSVELKLNVAPGVYIVELSDGQNVQSKKLVVQ